MGGNEPQQQGARAPQWSGREGEGTGDRHRGWVLPSITKSNAITGDLFGHQALQAGTFRLRLLVQVAL